jgi:hypothetical protein
MVPEPGGINGSKAALGAVSVVGAPEEDVTRSAAVSMESSAGEAVVTVAEEVDPANGGVQVPGSIAASVEPTGAGASGVTAEAPLGILDSVVSGAEVEASGGATDSGATESMAEKWRGEGRLLEEEIRLRFVTGQLRGRDAF